MADKKGSFTLNYLNSKIPLLDPFHSKSNRSQILNLNRLFSECHHKYFHFLYQNQKKDEPVHKKGVCSCKLYWRISEKLPRYFRNMLDFQRSAARWVLIIGLKVLVKHFLGSLALFNRLRTVNIVVYQLFLNKFNPLIV